LLYIDIIGEIFMKKTAILATIIIYCCLTVINLAASDFLTNSQIVFETAQGARNHLRTNDIYLQNMSPFDRSARLKTSRDVSHSEYLDFISLQTLDWNENEIQRITGIMVNIGRSLSDYNMSFPDKIIFIKTTGLEEGNAAYCRGNNIIVLPVITLDYQTDRLYNLILHELFHIYTRNNAEIQERLYNILSFKKGNELRLPAEIFQWKITNPDAAVNNYFFSSRIGGRDFNLMPVLLSSGNYDERRGGEFFDYLGLYFIAVTDNGSNTVPLILNSSYVIFNVNQVPNYYTLIGRNTNYIIHPEEILADNFVFLINNNRNLPNMEILERMREILKGN